MKRIHATLINRRAHAIGVGALMLLALTATLLIGCGGSGSGEVPVSSTASGTFDHDGDMAILTLTMQAWPEVCRIAFNETIDITDEGEAAHWQCVNPGTGLVWSYVSSTHTVTYQKTFLFHTNKDGIDLYGDAILTGTKTFEVPPYCEAFNLSGGISP